MAHGLVSPPAERQPELDNWHVGPPLLILLILIAAITVAAIGAIGYAYERIGLSPGWMLAVLLSCLVGSRINIPVARFRDRAVLEDLYFSAFGVRYRIPVMRHTGSSTLAINLGGAIIPATLACYLTVHDQIWETALVATAVVSMVVWLVSRPVPGIGIATPALVPPITAAVTAIAVGGSALAAVAFVSGTLGTMVGADLFNIRRIRDLRAPIASIGGAGTFDGIFLSGVLAVLLAH
jgi:uncharacterized membrane protein